MRQKYVGGQVNKKQAHCDLCYGYIDGLKNWNSNPCVCPNQIWQFLSYQFLMAFKKVMLVIVHYIIRKTSSRCKQRCYYDQLTSLQCYTVKHQPETNRHLPRDSSIAYFFGQPQVSIKNSMLSVSSEYLLFFIVPKVLIQSLHMRR